MRQLFYYKMRQKSITKCVRFFITKCDSFITKCDSYYKMRRFYYKNAIVITKCDLNYKLWQYKVERFFFFFFFKLTRFPFFLMKRAIKLEIIFTVAYMWRVWLIYVCIRLSYDFSMLGQVTGETCKLAITIHNWQNYHLVLLCEIRPLRVLTFEMRRWMSHTVNEPEVHI